MNSNEGEKKPGRQRPHGSDDVGYGKPPKRSQFRKGTSGNPNGRPKKKVLARDAFNMVFSQPVKVTMNARTQTVSAMEATLMQLRSQVLQGDLRAIRLLFQHADKFGILSSTNGSDRLDELLTAMQAGGVPRPKPGETYPPVPDEPDSDD